MPNVCLNLDSPTSLTSPTRHPQGSRENPFSVDGSSPPHQRSGLDEAHSLPTDSASESSSPHGAADAAAGRSNPPSGDGYVGGLAGGIAGWMRSHFGGGPG